MYKREEIYNETLQYFHGDTLATDVWINKYCLKDHEGNFYEKTPEDMHRRLASELARVEKKYAEPMSEQTIFELLNRFRYIVPQGSPMAGIGNTKQIVSLGNCFVIGNDSDSYGGIMQLEEQMVQLMKRRGGVGIDLSHIRPKGSPVHNAAITSTGVVPFMNRYSNGTREVAQDGRRGALMLTIDIKHPDAEDFIDAKLELKQVTGANISVKVSDEFMRCVQSGEPFIQQFPCAATDPVMTKEIDAKKLWKKMMHNAWKSAEPGILFWDQIISESPADCYAEQGFRTVSTNPCVTGDTLVFTNIGWIEIQHLDEWKSKINDLTIITMNQKRELYNSNLKWVGITKKQDSIYRVDFSNNGYIKCNKTHKLYNEDFDEVELAKHVVGDRCISHLGTTTCLKITDLNIKEDVWDLTAEPNFNFFSLAGDDETIITDKIVINDEVSYYYFDLIDTERGTIFAYQLEEGDEIL